MQEQLIIVTPSQLEEVFAVLNDSISTSPELSVVPNGELSPILQAQYFINIYNQMFAKED